MEKAPALDYDQASLRGDDDFRSLVDQAPVLMWAIDTKLQLIYANHNTLSYIGLKSLKNYRREIWKKVIHPDDIQRVFDAVEIGLKRKAPYTQEARLKDHATSLYHWHVMRGMPRYNDAGLLVGFIGTATNIDKLKMTEFELAKSEQRLGAIFNQTTAGILQTDIYGNFTFVNPGYCQIVGRTPRELYKLNIMDITHPDDALDNMRQLKKLAKTGRDFVVRKRYIKPDGSYVWVRNNVSPLKDKNGIINSILAVSVNIHEQEEATKALQASEEKLRLATEAGKVGTWEWDIIADKTTWSDELHHIYGMELGTFGGGIESDLSLIHPDDKGMVRAILEKTVKHGHDFEIEFRIFRADGKIRWLSERGRVHRNAKSTAIRVSGTRMDITERKLAQEALRQSEVRLRFMAESMPQKVFAAKPNGEIDYFNPQWSEFTGLAIGEIKKWGWTQIVHPDDLKETLRRWKHSVKTGEPFEFEHRFRQHDGSYRWHITRAHAMHDEAGGIVRWFGSNTDIEDIKNTTRRRDELEGITATLKKQQAELVMLNQAKDEFISLASHQLRTPASGVKQLLGMLLEGFVEDLKPGQRRLIERANESNERQILVINDLLRVAQVDAGKVELYYREVNLVSLVQDILDGQERMFADRNQSVTFLHTRDKLPVMLDAQRIRMVIENIIDNASKYTYPGKSIQVTLLERQESILISIKDQGVGIRKADMAKLFHKFSRLPNALSIAVGGTGLGLYWAHKIVQLHGGRIEVESRLGHGSTFTIVLPLQPSK